MASQAETSNIPINEIDLEDTYPAAIIPLRHTCGDISTISSIWGLSSIPSHCPECTTRSSDDTVSDRFISSNLWVCLVCWHIGCGRDIYGHALQHGESTRHAYVMCIDDLSVYSYADDAYLDVYAIPVLQSLYIAAHEMKFNETPPMPHIHCDTCE